MTVDFSNTANQRIDFGATPTLRSVPKKTFIFWTYIDTLSVGDFFGMGGSASTDEDWAIDIDPSNKMYFIVNWSTTSGWWYTNAALTTGLHHIAVTYDYGSTANDPVFYVDGASVAITQLDNPAGTYRTGTNNSFRIGSYLTGFSAVNCKMHSLSIYNRIFTAAEVASAYVSRLFIPSYNGLIFAPNLNGPAGGLADGATMAAGNTIRDLVSGATGTPAGSPVFKANTLLTLGGE